MVSLFKHLLIWNSSIMTFFSPTATRRHATMSEILNYCLPVRKLSPINILIMVIWVWWVQPAWTIHPVVYSSGWYFFLINLIPVLLVVVTVPCLGCLLRMIFFFFLSFLFIIYLIDRFKKGLFYNKSIDRLYSPEHNLNKNDTTRFKLLK